MNQVEWEAKTMDVIDLYAENWYSLVVAIFKIVKRDFDCPELSSDAKNFARTRWAEELLDFLGYNQEAVLKTWGLL